MSEALNDHNPEPFDGQRYIDLIRRRAPHFLMGLFFGWSVIWGISWFLPETYRSSTLILVEQPTMPKDYVVSNINENLQDRIQNISQQILSRTRLLHIIDQLNLYGGSSSKLTPDEKAARMRKDIEIELVRDARNLEITAFKIYYSARDPRVAQQVTSELTNLFINENLEVRQQQSEDTTKFLETQLEFARRSLAAQDAKIRAFKGQHIGDLPTQQASNLQILSGLQSQLGGEQDALNTAQQQRIYLETLISQYRSVQTPVKTSPEGMPASLSTIDQQLSKLRSQLAALSSQYTDQHPDIRSLKIEISKTEKMRSELASELKNKSSTSSQADKTGVSDPSEVEKNAAVLQLQSQLQANKAELANRQQSIAALQAKINDYQSRLNDEPVREQQLADLTRDYDQSKANYDDLLKKEIDSKMATSMEQMQKGERFRMIDPPSLPMKPASPDRLKLSGMGLGLGLVLGIAVAGGLEFIDDRLYSEKQLKDLLPMKVISEIPEVVNAADKLRHKRGEWLMWAMTVMTLVTIAVGSFLSYRHS